MKLCSESTTFDDFRTVIAKAGYSIVNIEDDVDVEIESEIDRDQRKIDTAKKKMYYQLHGYAGIITAGYRGVSGRNRSKRMTSALSRLKKLSGLFTRSVDSTPSSANGSISMRTAHILSFILRIVVV